MILLDKNDSVLENVSGYNQCKDKDHGMMEKKEHDYS